MKVSAHLSIVYHDYEKRGIIQELRELFPFGKYHAGFQVIAPPDDPRLNEVIKLLEERGIPPRDLSKKERPPVEYLLDYNRTYAPEDFDSASYLQFVHQVLISEDQECDLEGRLMLPPTKLRPYLRIGCVLFQATVVVDTLRQEMLNARLIGVQFKEVVMNGVVRHDFWELTSSITLPPMPRERLIPRPIAPDDYVHVAGIRDGEFLEKEIHYDSREIPKIEPFDFGLTFEIFGGERWPVVSQRFRQFCQTQRLDVSWKPVRIDP